MDTPIRNFQRGDIRVSDTERDQAVAELSDHFQSGRLTLEEFDDRSGRALRAQTGNDLRALFADLPRPVAPVASPPVNPVMPSGPHWSGLPVARAVIAFVIAGIILGNVTGHHGHHPIGWLVPVVILGLVFLRLSRRHRRRI